CGKDGRRMQDLGAEVGKLSGLFEADDLDAARVGTDARIGGLHAIHVGPDFDAVGVKTCSHEGSGKIGTAAADGSLHAFAGRANETSHDRHAPLLDQRLDAVLWRSLISPT